MNRARETSPVVPRPRPEAAPLGRAGRRRPALAWIAALLGLVTGVARGEDVGARQRFLADADASALVKALAASPDAADRAALALARLAADPQVRIARGDEAYPLAVAVDALRMLDLARARAALEAAGTASPGPLAWLLALLDARTGHDEAALQRLLAAGPPAVPGAAASGRRVAGVRRPFDLALLGAALPRDDRELLCGVARAAILRASATGRTDRVQGLAEDAARLDPRVGGRGLVIAARALRRAGRAGEAQALLAGAPAVRAAAVSAATRDDFRLESALIAWRQGDAAGARAACQSARPDSAWAWAHLALRAAGKPPAVVPAAPQPLAEAGADADAAAIARFASVLGVPTKAEDVAAAAAPGGGTAADPAFQRTFLARLRLPTIEVAGDAALVRDALDRGLAVLFFRPRRRADRFVDHPVVLRGHDRDTDLCVADEPDGDVVDVVPGAWLSKGRAVVGAPTSRAAELAGWRAAPAARLGVAVADLLTAAGEPALAEAALEAFARRAPEFPGLPAFELYLGCASYWAALAAKDPARRAVAGAVLRRSSAVEPALAMERFVRVMEGSGSTDAADAQAMDLLEAARLEGPAAYLEAGRFEVYKRARRQAEALECIQAARTLDPFDERTLYARGSTRRLTGDAPGARADLVRLLDRRPEYLDAAEELVNLYLEAGQLERGLAVVAALVAASPRGAEARRVHVLRQRIELRLVRQSRAAADLVPLAKSPEADTRKEVAWAAASFESPEAEALLKSLLLDADEGVRRKAAQAFQRPWLVDRLSEDAGVLALLVPLLAKDPAPAVREAAAQALGRVDTAPAEAALVGRLVGPSRDPEAGVRIAVCEALSGRESAVSKRAFVSALADEDAGVRASALRALQRLAGDARGFEPEGPADRSGRGGARLGAVAHDREVTLP